MDVLDRLDFFEEELEIVYIERVFRDRLSPFDVYDEKTFQDRYRLGKEAMHMLINILRPELQRATHRNEAISPELQVSCYFFAYDFVKLLIMLYDRVVLILTVY